MFDKQCVIKNCDNIAKFCEKKRYYCSQHYLSYLEKEVEKENKKDLKVFNSFLKFHAEYLLSKNINKKEVDDLKRKYHSYPEIILIFKQHNSFIESCNDDNIISVIDDFKQNKDLSFSWFDAVDKNCFDDFFNKLKKENKLFSSII